MAGLTHSALRTLLLSFGGIGLLSTEMLSAGRLPKENPRVSPYLFRTEKEVPLSYQILVMNLASIEPAVKALHSLQADAIDFNLGCPAPRVRKAGGGSCLAGDFSLVHDMIQTARRCTDLPVSAKIRLGEELDASRLQEFCQMLEGAGLDLLSVHARLRKESFERKPRWDWVGKVKDWVNIPVVANGGIASVQDGKRCLELSGADGLMIGRAAAVKPWLFADLAREVYGLDVPYKPVCLPLVYRAFVAALQERFRPERRLGRLKEFTHYFAQNYFFGHHLASRVQSSQSVHQAWDVAVNFFTTNDPQGFATLQKECGPEPMLPAEISSESISV